MNIQEGINEFIIYEKVSGSTQATILHYENQLKIFSDFLCNKDLKDITYKDYERYILYLRNKNKTTRVCKGQKEKLSGRTIKTYASAVRTFLSYLYKNKYIDIDIAEEIKMPKYKKKTIVILSDIEIECLIRSQNEFTFTGSRNLFIISLMLDCGLRLAEVSKLRFCDIFLDRKLINVDGKGQKERLVPMSDTTIHYYNIYIDMLKKSLNRSLFSGEIILKTQDLQDISKNSIALIFKRLKKKLKFNNLSPHLLRHTFATLFILNGGDIVNLQIILGHTTLDMSLKYLHLANQLKLAEQSRFSPLTNLLGQK